MQRITASFDDELAEDIDRFIAERGYESRSEALRDLARAGLQHMRMAGEAGSAAETGECVGVLVYAYEHDMRELAKRLTHRQHHNHDLTLFTSHVHLDHHTCLEATLLRGPLPEVRTFAAGVIGERGVRHGQLMVLPVETTEERHDHGGRAGAHTHVKVRSSGG